MKFKFILILLIVFSYAQDTTLFISTVHYNSILDSKKPNIDILSPLAGDSYINGSFTITFNVEDDAMISESNIYKNNSIGD